MKEIGIATIIMKCPQPAIPNCNHNIVATIQAAKQHSSVQSGLSHLAFDQMRVVTTRQHPAEMKNREDLTGSPETSLNVRTSMTLDSPNASHDQRFGTMFESFV